MSIIKMGQLGFALLLGTLLLVIATAYYHSHSVISELGNSVTVLAPAHEGVREADRLITVSGFAFLKFVNRDVIQATDVEVAFNRLVTSEKDLIAGMPAEQIPAAFRNSPARKAWSIFYAFLEQEAYEPAGDTSIQLADATRAALNEIRQTLAAADLSADPFGQATEKLQKFRNLIATTETMFVRYANRATVSLTEVVTPANKVLKTIDALPYAELATLTQVNRERHPASAHPDIDAIRKAIKTYRASLFAYDDAVQAGMSGTALIESQRAARNALHQARRVLSRANEDLTRHVHRIQKSSIATAKVSQALFLGIAALGALASLFIAYWVGTSMARRLNKLSDAAEQIGVGQLELEIEGTSNDALGKVAVAFNQMAAELRHREETLARHIGELDDTRQQLHEANDGLERRVADRTRALHEANNHLSDVVGELKLAKETAETANRAKSDFLANMSHELRTPLNAIIGYTELIQEEAVDRNDQTLMKDLAKVSNAGRHLLGLISNVLDLSKVEAGKMELDLQETNLDELLAEINDTVQPLVADKDNTFDFANTATVAAFVTDTQKLRQALLNLLGNATKFTRDGAVRLAVTQEPAGWLNFIVSDTGVGMDADQLSKILKPFTQANTEVSTKYGGTGLGLTITKSFAELLGGHLDAESAPGQGSRFTISLPIQQAETAGASVRTA